MKLIAVELSWMLVLALFGSSSWVDIDCRWQFIMHWVLESGSWSSAYELQDQCGTNWWKKASMKDTFSRWTAEFHLCPEYLEMGQSKLVICINPPPLLVCNLLIELADLRAQGYLEDFRLHHYMQIWQVRLRSSRRGASSARTTSWLSWRFPSDASSHIIQHFAEWRLPHMKEYMQALSSRQ